MDGNYHKTCYGRGMFCGILCKMAIRKNSLSYWVLVSLEKLVDGTVRVNDFINKPGYYAYGDGWGYPLDKSDLAQAIKRLRERGLLKEDKINEQEVLIKLTELGKETLGVGFNEKDWDGKYRVVLFDIPEQKRRVRDLLRRKLKHWGFKAWQQSVWVTKHPITNKLRNSIKELGIEKWVAVLESDNLGSYHNLFNGRGR